MRVLIDIVHPADVLFFKRPIEALMDRGDEVLILSRRKDIACDLLAGFGLPHTPVTDAGRGMAGLALELLTRDLKVFRHALAFRPNVMIGFGGVAISHAGVLSRRPSVSFYDSEKASLQTRLTWPFISALYVPEAYNGSTPAGRTTRLKGVKELSYLHPSAFAPDKKAAIDAGLDPERDNYFIRLVAWRANHDLGKRGWNETLLRRMVERLSQTGRVHLSSEDPLPADLARHAYCGPKTAVHHMLAHCRLQIGESATMASEAAMLGVPAVYAGGIVWGYMRELGDAGLIRIEEELSEATLMKAIDDAMSPPLSDVRARRDAYVANCPNWAEEVVAAIDRHAKR